MTNDMSGNFTQMMWKPKLIRLTQIGNPDAYGGRPMPAYLDPATIMSITATVGAFPTLADPAAKHPLVECTLIFYCHGHLHVLESPEKIAMLRDAALGHEWKPLEVGARHGN